MTQRASRSCALLQSTPYRRAQRGRTLQPNQLVAAHKSPISVHSSSLLRRTIPESMYMPSSFVQPTLYAEYVVQLYGAKLDGKCSCQLDS